MARKNKSRKNRKKVDRQPAKQNQGKWLRCRIEGKLTTRAPLHIGSGLTVTRPKLKAEEDRPAEITAITVDAEGQACIHGSALKGVLRSRLEESVLEDNFKESFYRLFGKKGENSDSSLGGAAVFHDALIINPIQFTEEPDPAAYPYWDGQRQTVVESNTSINRSTRTVEKNHLFYTEAVPAGVSFQTVITGNLSRKETLFLIAAISMLFGGTENLTALGANTANGWGKVTWELSKVSAFSDQDLITWLNDDDRLPIEDLLNKKKPDNSIKVKKITGLETGKPSAKYDIFPVSLQFDASFITSMIQKTEKIDGIDRKSSVTRKTADNKFILPASSFRGALRSQAERILRTMADSEEKGFELACNPLLKQAQKGCCHKIESVQEKNKLCLICQLFGASGWRSPLYVSDFTMSASDTAQYQTHRMIAVDRFTGAAKDSALFTLQGGWRPALHGTLRYSRRDLPEGGLALLAMTLRDLMEGDIFFGYGRSRGYGSCICSWQTDKPLWDDKGFREAVKEDRKALNELVESRREAVVI